MVRHDWDSLPASVRASIEDRCGEVVKAESPSAGRNSDFAATLYLDADHKVFCKGIMVDRQTARMHRTEARVNPRLPASAPRLLWQFEGEGWLLLGFEYVAGRHANLSPGSRDLPLIADTVSTLARDLTPCGVDGLPTLAGKMERMTAWQRLHDDTPTELDPWARDNLDRFVGQERSAIELIAGDTLLHTDLHSLNILVADTPSVVNWAWAKIGATWVDAAYLVIRMIEAGHSPEEAERWAKSTAAWSERSNREAITAFAVAVFGMWEYLKHAAPLPLREPATRAAREWARHRLGEGHINTLDNQATCTSDRDGPGVDQAGK